MKHLPSRILKIILISSFGLFTLVALVELTSFIMMNLGYTLINTSYQKALNADTTERLYAKGLPSQYKPYGNPIGAVAPMSVIMSCSPAFDDYDWSEAFWKEEHKRSLLAEMEKLIRFQPNVLWRLNQREGEYFNIDHYGIRRTINKKPDSYSKTKKIFMFGGSTMEGIGVPDNFTIPSFLSKELNSSGDTYYEVTNFGTIAFILEQDIQLFLDEIRKGNIPDIAIFYHGINDTLAGVFNPGKPGWVLNSELMEAKLSAEINVATLFDSPLGFQGLHTYDLISTTKTILSSMNQKKVSEPDEEEFLFDSPQYTYLENYSVRSQNFAERYKANLKLIHTLCEAYSIQPYFIWQPILAYGNKKLDKFEKALLTPALFTLYSLDEEQGLYQKNALQTTYQLIEETDFEGIDNFYNFSHIFDSIKAPIYADFVHLGPKGNEIIAHEIVKVIKDNKDNH